MKVIVLYEQKQYICEMKQNFTAEDVIYNMRKTLGDKENQKYILCDINGKHIDNFHLFFPTNKKEESLILMKIPKFKEEEPLYNDNIKDDIINVTDDGISSNYDFLQKFPVNHGNPDKKREPSFELIANIFGSFNDLPDLERETSKK